MPFPAKTDRETILATALAQVEREGIEKLGIRVVAGELGITPNAIYRYFASLAELVGALAEESRLRQLEALRRGAAKKGSVEAIRGIATAYLRFAREEPRLFSLTLLPPPPSLAERPHEGDAVHVQMWRFVLGRVAAVYGEKRAPEAATALWAFLHGMTALEAAGVLGEHKPASSFELGLRLWIAGAEERGPKPTRR